MGVHGLPSSAYVMGSLSNQYIIQLGTGLTTTQARSLQGSSDADQYYAVNFPTTFASTPAVMVMAHEAESVRIGADGVSASGFTALFGYAYEPNNNTQTNTSFSWIAIGPI
jgi:hypothetical protein